MAKKLGKRMSMKTAGRVLIRLAVQKAKGKLTKKEAKRFHKATLDFKWRALRAM